MARPAARLTDMHVCPMQTPAVVPIPHVGGPIVSPGDPRTLIAGLPAARVGDLCICVGPPDVIAAGSATVFIGGQPAARLGDSTAHGGSIAAGCPTVLIGDSGGGSGSPQALTMQAARGSGAAFTRTNCAAAGVLATATHPALTSVGAERDGSWIEIELVDQHGRPVPHERYRVVPPGSDKPIEGFLDEHGFARISGINPGTCRITFPDADGSSWRPVRGDPGPAPRPDPLPYRPGIQRVEVRTVLAGRPGIGPVRVSTVSVTAPGIGPVRATVISATRPGIQSVRTRVLPAPAT